MEIIYPVVVVHSMCPNYTFLTVFTRYASSYSQVDMSNAAIASLIAEVSNDGDDTVDVEEWGRLVRNIYDGSKCSVQVSPDIR